MMAAITPWACGLVVDGPVWVTVVECGVPVWKKGILRRALDAHYRASVEVEGKVREFHQHDLRSFSYLRGFTS